MSARTIANVLLDVKANRAEVDKLEKAFRRTTDRAEEERISDKLAALDDRLDELRAEFSRLFETATGVAWSIVSEAAEYL